MKHTLKRTLKKLIITVQSDFHFLIEVKGALYYFGNKALRRPHEQDFRCLRFIPDDAPGSYLDVGANHGQSIESITLFKPHARIYSFEANAVLADKLSAHYLGRNNITVLSYGLAAENQSRTLYVPVYKGALYDDLASFDRGSAEGWLSPKTVYGFSPERLKVRETICTTRRLDDHAIEPVFIKIDVQGYEYQVVLGGMETIKRCEPILMIEDFFGNEKLVRLVQGMGYEQYLFDDTGFYRAETREDLNTILMTPHRARLVTISKQRAQAGEATYSLSGRGDAPAEARSRYSGRL
jgi:FkbM family methyltransferase